MNRGYIKVWRKLEDSGLLQLPKTLALFMFLLMNATHKDKKMGTPTGVIELKRGQYISGRQELARKLKQSEQEIRTSLSRLENMEIITIKSTSKFSIYTIENYGIYQDDNQQSTSDITNKQPADNQQITTKQECKKERSKYLPPIGAELLAAWSEVRRAKRVGAVTELVYRGVEREALKAGITPEQAVTVCIQKGWASFDSTWNWQSALIESSNSQFGKANIV